MKELKNTLDDGSYQKSFAFFNQFFNPIHWLRSGVFIVNFEHISHFFLVLLLLTLNK